MLRGTKGIGGKRCRGEAYAKSVADNSIGLIQFPCGEGGEGRAVNICRPSFGTHSLAPRTDSFSSDRYEIPQVFDNPGRMRPKESVSKRFPTVPRPPPFPGISFPMQLRFRDFRGDHVHVLPFPRLRGKRANEFIITDSRIYLFAIRTIE